MQGFKNFFHKASFEEVKKLLPQTRFLKQIHLTFFCCLSLKFPKYLVQVSSYGHPRVPLLLIPPMVPFQLMNSKELLLFSG